MPPNSIRYFFLMYLSCYYVIIYRKCHLALNLKICMNVRFGVFDEWFREVKGNEYISLIHPVCYFIRECIEKQAHIH